MFAYSHVRGAGPRTHHGAVVRPWQQRDCQCGCHRERFDGEPYGPFPKAVEHGLCQSCADEAYQPWTATLASIT